MCRSPLLPLLARELGASPPMVGLAVAASTITGVIVKLPAGAWSDAIGRPPLLIAAAIVFAIMPFSYLTVASLTALIAARFLHGSATAMMGPVMSAAISDLAPADRRATWLSIYATCQGVGQAVGPVVAGVLIARGRYDIAFVLAGLVAAGGPWLIGTRPLRQVSRTSTATHDLGRGVREVLAERRLVVASIAHASFFVVSGTLNAFLPLFAQDRLHLDAAQIGTLFGMQTMTTLAVRPFIALASDRLGRRGAITLGLTGCALSVFMISLSGTTAALFAGTLSYAVAVAITTAAASAYITDVAPKSRFGAAHGVFGTIYDVGDAAGPLIGGVLVQCWGYTATFQAMALLAAATACTFAVLSRR